MKILAIGKIAIKGEIEMNKPEVGQVVYSWNVGNAATNCESKLTRRIVTKVGRNYFTTRPEGEYRDWYNTDTQHFIDSWEEKSDFVATSKLYVSEEAYKEEKEANELYSKAREFFRSYTNKLSLKQLKAIAGIINERSDI